MGFIKEGFNGGLVKVDFGIIGGLEFIGDYWQIKGFPWKPGFWGIGLI